MNLRKNTLWRIPVYYLAASTVNFYVLMSLYSGLCIKPTVGADGVATVETNEVLMTFLGLAVLAAVLCLGGLWLCRTMTKMEVAVSAGALTVVYLLWAGSELLFPGWDAALGFATSFMSLNAEVGGLVMRVIGSPVAASLIGCFTPMLFVCFGRNHLPESETKA